MIRLTLIIAALLFTQPAQAGWLEALFPSLKDNYNPYETMRAPFADPPEEAKTTDTGPMTREKILANIPKPGEIVPLHLPHTTQDEIKRWVITAVSGALSYDGTNNQSHHTNIRQYFTQSGFTQYNNFMQENRLNDVLASNRTKISSVVEMSPTILSEQARDGKYRWLLEAPILVSFLDANAQSYTSTKPINRKGSLQIQIVRAKPTDKNPNDVRIELWKATLKAE